MWKCPKCGEEIEDQFGSCWKCAAAVEQAGTPAAARPCTSRDYGALVVASALPPLLALGIQSYCNWKPGREYQALLFRADSVMLWCFVFCEWLVTAGILFTFRGWLSGRAERWGLFLGCCILWLMVAFALTPALRRGLPL